MDWPKCTTTMSSSTYSQGHEFLISYLPFSFDIKPANILLGANMEPIIADFGVTALVHSTKPDAEADRIMARQGGSQIKGFTSAYCAPELFDRPAVVTMEHAKCDVYAFAITFWELLTRQVPFGPKDGHRLPATYIKQCVKKGERPPMPPGLPETYPEIAAIIEKGWAQDALSRPNMPDVAHQLRSLIAE